MDLARKIMGIVWLWAALVLQGMAHAQNAAAPLVRLAEVSVDDPLGQVLDADLGEPDPAQSRAYVHGGVTLLVTFRSPLIVAAQYRLAFRLLAPDGSAWPLVGAEGAPADAVTVDVSVSRPLTGTVARRRVPVALRPAVRLEEGTLYRLESVLLADQGLGLQPVGSLTENEGRGFFHFANTQSPDPALNVLARLESASLGLENGRPRLRCKIAAARFDDFTEDLGSVDVGFRLRFVLRDVVANIEVPLEVGEWSWSRAMSSWIDRREAAVVVVEDSVELNPATPLQWGRDYAVHVVLEHFEPDGSAREHQAMDTPAVGLVGLSGRLFFGSVETTFSSISNDPRVGAVPNPDFPNDGLKTTLAVNGQSGRLPARPAFTFGDGTAMPVQVFGNGDALFLGNGSVVLAGSINGRDQVGNVRFGYARLELTQSGLSAVEGYAGFPAGSGFAADGATRVMENRMPLGRVALTAEARPLSSRFTLRAADFGLGSLWVHDEALPLRLATPRIDWLADQNAFEFETGSWDYVRRREMEFTDDPLRTAVLSVEQRRRPANDGYFAFAQGASGPVRLVVDEQGRGRLDASVSLGSGEFESHFPSGISLSVAGGQVVLSGDRIDEASSQVIAMAGRPAALVYGQGCPDPGCVGAGDGTISFEPVDGTFRVTADGGLQAVVVTHDAALNSSALEWGALGGGRFAHSVSAFDSGTFHQPGYRLNADATSAHLKDGDRPAAILWSGFGRENGGAFVERPQTEGYATGAADYAGLNFRVTDDGSASAVSYLAGQHVPGAGSYPLKGNSKYYVRQSGVSGRHQAVAGQFPKDLVLYGFATSLDGLRLSYLDNRVERSATDGGITVPFPSDFVQEFSELRLRCNGQLWDARIRGDARLVLAYWLAPFQASTMEFRGAAEAPCDTQAGVLLLGSKVTLPGIERPAIGVLGFQSTGQLVTAEDGIPGVDSRLDVPGSLEFSGPENRSYRFSTASKAYLNRWPGAGADPADGFVNLVGKIDLPWFLDCKVHVHAVGGGANPVLFLAGGWNNNGRPDDPARAWVDAAGHSFFDRQDFDAGQRGFPDSVTIQIYRDSGAERFRPRAQQRLLGLPTAEVDFPIAWQPASRSFKSAGNQTANALVFELQGEAARLTSRRAHLNFGAKLAEKVPSFSASEFLLGEVEGQTGFFSSVSNAISRALNDNQVASKLREGADAMDRLLVPDLGSWLGSDLLSALDGPIDRLLDEVAAKADAGLADAGNFQRALCQHLASGGTALNQFQSQFLETSDFLETVTRKVVNSLRTVDDGLTSGIDVVKLREVAPLKFQRTVVAEMVKRAVREAPPDAPPLVRALAENVAPQVLDDLIDEYLADALEPSLAQVESTLRDVHGELSKAIEDLDAARGGLRDGLAQAQEALVTAGSFYRDATNALCMDLRALTLPVTQALQDRARLRDQMKRVVLAEILKGVFPKETHLVLKQLLLADRGLFRGALEQLFAHVNDTLVGIALGPARDLVKGPVEQLDAGAVEALEKLRGILEGTRVYGTADITDDELRKLRVDGEFRFAMGPADMGGDGRLALDAFYEVEQYRGDAPGRGCRAAGGTFTEIRFGAGTTPAGGFAQGLKLEASGRYALDPAGRLLGVAGGITATGTKRIGGFTAKDPQFGFSFGEEGTYLGGTVAGRFKDFTLQARLFAGQACRLGELELIDPITASVLGDHGIKSADPVAGFYVAGDMTIPLEKFLPIPLPSTCLLRLEARGGIGYFGFYSPKDIAFLIGFRQRYGLKGDLLCFLSGEGDLDLVGAVGVNSLGTPQATLGGRLKVGAEVGICPICEDVSKTFPWVVHLRSDDVVFDPPF
ncbi:MAG: hypothetical protein IT581_19220 [Verrucomicrobiales bacterium]|nr:hypothetical protein [Verrucomicrobiales bacterium]